MALLLLSALALSYGAQVAAKAAVDLVASFAVYGPGAINRAPFLLSLRASGYTGKIVLAVGTKLADDDQRTMRELDVEFFPVKTFSSSDHSCGDFCMETPFGPMHVQVGRYFFYRDVIQNAGLEKKSRVLISDFRDTYFQQHPFHNAYFSTDGPSLDLLFFEETSWTITKSFWNFTSWWISTCFGEEAVADLEAYPVLCSGTTMGTAQGVANYLHIFLATLQRQLEHGTEQQKADCRGIAGIDQGIHNYVALKGLVNEFVPVMLPNGHGPVNTANGKPQPARPLRQNELGIVLNQGGQPSPVVHQFDRCPEV
ncbi:unnamed protein product, partial [Phaeothamnion confervicola]